MSYRVQLTEDAEGIIGSWGLARETLLQVLSRLTLELPSDPDAHLRERVAPLAYFAYKFALGQTPQRLFFMFAVDRLDEEKLLRVVGGRVVRETDLLGEADN